MLSTAITKEVTCRVASNQRFSEIMVRCKGAQKIVDTFEPMLQKCHISIVCMLSSFDSSNTSNTSTTRSKSNKDKVRWHLSQQYRSIFILPSESTHNYRTPNNEHNSLDSVSFVRFIVCTRWIFELTALTSLSPFFLSPVCIVLARYSMVCSMHTLIPFVSSYLVAFGLGGFFFSSQVMCNSWVHL